MAEVIEKKAAAEKATPMVSEAVNALGKVFAKSLKVVKREGDARELDVEIEGDLVADNLPDDVSVASIKRHEKIRSEMVAAGVRALTEVGLPALKKNKDAEKVHMSFKFGNDKIDLALEREREFNDGQGGKIKKYGYVSLGYTATGATNAGEFKKARQMAASEAEKLFG